MNSLISTQLFSKQGLQGQNVQGNNLKNGPIFSNILKSYNGWPPDSELWPPNPSPGDFYMVFKPGFPKDLSDKLKAMQSDPQTDQKKFMSMYLLTFSPENFGPAWDSSWERRLALTIQTSRALIGSLDAPYRANAIEMYNRLESLLMKKAPLA